MKEEKEIFDYSFSEWENRIKNNCTKFSDNFIDIIEIVSSYEGKPCIHCGYGNYQYFIFQQSDDSYGYVEYFPGCLTFNATGSVYIKKSLDELKIYTNENINF